jgi:general secretion pathway protein E
MSHHSIRTTINQLIHKNSRIIECKKRAKALQKSLKQKDILMQCQNHIAKEMGYVDWFDLYHSVKQEVLRSHDFSYHEPDFFRSQFEKLLQFALQENATDIHIETRKDFRIRMRVLGDLFDYTEQFLDIKNIDLLCQTILHLIAQTDNITLNPEKYFQQAMSEYTFATTRYDLNTQKIQIFFQSLPVYPTGYDIVLRLKPFNSEHEHELTHLGYSQSHIEMIHHIMQNRQGSFFLSGATGSGLSTSIRHIVNDWNASSHYTKKIATIDEHPEKSLYKIDHIPIIREALNLRDTYSPLTAPLQSVLNNHYDMTHINYRHLGETTELISQVIEQQLVISSLNASSAIGIIARLNDFGFDYFTLGQADNKNNHQEKSFLSGLSYQKLCPVVCPHCSFKLVNALEKGQSNDAILAVASRIAKAYPELKHESFNLISLRGSGCEHCHHKGIIDRTVCAEIIVIDDEMRNIIHHNQLTELYRLWTNTSDNNPLSDNMQGKTAYEHAIYKMFSGLICPFDIENIFKPIGT